MQQYKQLSSREQNLVVACVLMITIGLFYWLIWSPLNTSLERNRIAVTAKESELAWVTQNANRAIQLKSRAGNKQRFSGSLPQVVNQFAARNRIAISRMQPQGDELKVWVDKASFNDVLSWLQSLENSGISILDADFSKADEPGLIKVRNLKLGKA